VTEGSTKTLNTGGAEGGTFYFSGVTIGGTLLGSGPNPLQIWSTGPIVIGSSGLIDVSGGNGATSKTRVVSAGGGAGGGAVALIAPSIQVDGTIRANGGQGGQLIRNGGSGNGAGGVGVAGGASGGQGAVQGGTGSRGAGTGGGAGGPYHSGWGCPGGGGGYAQAGDDGVNPPYSQTAAGGSSYGDAQLSTGLLGGSGGGGGGNDGDNEEAEGGGGSGGTIWLRTVEMTVGSSHSMSATGGSVPTPILGHSDIRGGDGSVGRIRIDYATLTGSLSSISPAPGYHLDVATTDNCPISSAEMAALQTG